MSPPPDVTTLDRPEVVETAPLPAREPDDLDLDDLDPAEVWRRIYVLAGVEMPIDPTQGVA